MGEAWKRISKAERHQKLRQVAVTLDGGELREGSDLLEVTQQPGDERVGIWARRPLRLSQGNETYRAGAASWLWGQRSSPTEETACERGSRAVASVCGLWGWSS